MDEKLFTKPNGRLARIPEGLAFVPRPLPPEIPLTLALLKAAEEARGALGELNGVGRILPNPHVLVYPYMRREALLSSRIEGTQATLSDVFRQEAVNPSSGSQDVQEVLNYVAAMELGLKRVETIPLCLNLFKEVHARLLSRGVRGQNRAPGQFRRSQAFIGPTDGTIEGASYVPPPADEMTKLLDDWEKYLHSDDELSPLIRCSLLHYQFEAIHPFYDGNGRVGRVMVILYLMEKGLLSYPLLYLSAFFERHRRSYYDRLLAVSTESDWAGWLTFFLTGVAEQATAATEDCHRLLALRQKLIAELTENHARPTSFRVVDYLFANPYLRTTALADMLKLTFRAVQMAVDQLVEMGWIREVTGRHRNRLYLAPAVLAAIEGRSE